MSGKERPQPTNWTSPERHKFVSAAVILGTMLGQEFNTAIADVDDLHRAGRLVVSSNTHTDNSHFLFTSKVTQTEELGYLSLRAITDMILGQMLDRSEIVYPFLDQGYYLTLSAGDKTSIATSLLGVTELLHGKPLSDWDPALKLAIAKTGVPYWHEEASDKIDRLRRLFSDEDYTHVTKSWQGVTQSHLSELMKSYQGGEWLP